MFFPNKRNIYVIAYVEKKMDVILATWVNTLRDLISYWVHLSHSISFIFAQTFYVLNYIALLNLYCALNYVLLVIKPMPCL